MCLFVLYSRITCNFMRFLTRRVRSWIRGLSYKPATSLENYHDGVCFRTAFIGHASALSQAYYAPLRGASLSSFRQAFVDNFMHGMWRLPSVQGFHDEELPRERVLDDKSAVGKESEHSQASSTQIVIYLYNKTKDHVAPGFRCAGCIVIAANFY